MSNRDCCPNVFPLDFLVGEKSNKFCNVQATKSFQILNCPDSCTNYKGLSDSHTAVVVYLDSFGILNTSIFLDDCQSFPLFLLTDDKTFCYDPFYQLNPNHIQIQYLSTYPTLFISFSGNNRTCSMSSNTPIQNNRSLGLKMS